MLKCLGVNIENLTHHIRDKFDFLDDVFMDVAGRECVITSGNDEQHMVGSLHYKDRAIDVRIKDISRQKAAIAYEQIVKEFGPDFDVLFEPTHIHIEYDPE